MRRLEGWERRLGDVIEAARAKSFGWGAHDCAKFAAECVAAMTGEDLYARFRGLYQNQAEALSCLGPYGGSVRGVAQYFFGHGHSNPGHARRGDLALVPTETGPALGIVSLCGRHVCAAGPAGLSFYPLKTALRFWAV